MGISTMLLEAIQCLIVTVAQLSVVLLELNRVFIRYDKSFAHIAIEHPIMIPDMGSHIDDLSVFPGVKFVHMGLVPCNSWLQLMA